MALQEPLVCEKKGNLLKGVPGDRGAVKPTTHSFGVALFLRDSVPEVIEISNLLVSARESFPLF